MSNPTHDEMRALQAEVESLRQQLLVASRLASLGTMAASVAHEFNNILVPVVGYAQMAAQTLKSAKPDLALVEKAVAKAAAGGEKAGQICSAMLGFARHPSSGPKSDGGVADLAAVVEDALAVMARDAAKDGINVVVDVPARTYVRMDAVHAEQVIVNLLLNSRQAMTSGPRRGRGTITIKARAVGPRIELTVTDDGPGIPAELRAKVFDPFFSTKGDGEGCGTGLGLAICRQIVTAAAGEIVLRPSPVGATGCQFCITLHAGSPVQAKPVTQAA